MAVLTKDMQDDFFAITPKQLFIRGNQWFQEGIISFTQYSLLSIPCEESAKTGSSVPINAIDFFKALINEEFAHGVKEQLDKLIHLLKKMNVKR
jgi:hypothetical protein